MTTRKCSVDFDKKGLKVTQNKKYFKAKNSAERKKLRGRVCFFGFGFGMIISVTISTVK